MKESAVPPAPSRRAPGAVSRRATNVTLPDTLLGQARALEINLSQACEAGLQDAVAERTRALWLAENRAAIDTWNKHVVTHGLPLVAYRQF
jgi:antitoxin CcdA